jgi:hypothetical protein
MYIFKYAYATKYYLITRIEEHAEILSTIAKRKYRGSEPPVSH